MGEVVLVKVSTQTVMMSDSHEGEEEIQVATKVDNGSKRDMPTMLDKIPPSVNTHITSTSSQLVCLPPMHIGLPVARDNDDGIQTLLPNVQASRGNNAEVKYEAAKSETTVTLSQPVNPAEAQNEPANSGMTSTISQTVNQMVTDNQTTALQIEPTIYDATLANVFFPAPAPLVQTACPRGRHRILVVWAFTQLKHGYSI